MKKNLLLIVLLALGTGLFALEYDEVQDESEKKEINFKNEIYFSAGLPSGVSLFESFLNYGCYIAPPETITEFSMLYPKMPALEVGYTFYCRKALSLGAMVGYEFGQYKTFDYDTNNLVNTEWTNRVTAMGEISLVLPKKFYLVYFKAGVGIRMEFSSHVDKGFEIMPAFNVCPVGLKFLLKNDYCINAELNLGSNSLLSVGLSKGW